MVKFSSHPDASVEFDPCPDSLPIYVAVRDTLGAFPGGVDFRYDADGKTANRSSCTTLTGGVLLEGSLGRRHWMGENEHKRGGCE